jgi:hypothetical protein
MNWGGDSCQVRVGRACDLPRISTGKVEVQRTLAKHVALHGSDHPLPVEPFLLEPQ